MPVDPSDHWHDPQPRSTSTRIPSNDYPSCSQLFTSLDERTHYNSLSPICSTIPPEILAQIFVFLAVDERPNSRRLSPSLRNSDTNPRLGWIKVTHVCRHWRNVALDYSFLWGNISYDIGTKWTTLMMERVKSAPVTLKQRISQKISATAAGEVEFIPSHIGQTEELALCADAKELTQIMDTLKDKAAPRLTKLSLSTTLGLTATGPAFAIRDDMFASGVVPRLRCLTLWNCHLLWSSPLLNNLTVLDFSQDKILALAPPTVEDFFTVLRRLPRLKHLSLDRTLPSFPSADLKTIRSLQPHSFPLHFPELSWLALNGKHTDCHALLHNISFPAFIYVSLRLQPSSPPIENPHHDIIEEVAKRVQGHSNDLLPVSHVYIITPGLWANIGDEPLVRLKIELPHRIDSPDGTKYATTWDIEFDLEDDEEQPCWRMGSIIEDFVQSIPISEAKYLELKSPDTWDPDPDDLLVVLREMGRLETVRMSGRVVCALPVILKRHKKVSGASSATVRYLPFLRHLELFNCDFWEGSGPRLLDMFRGALTYRKILRCAVRTLSFDGCRYEHDVLPTRKEFGDCCDELKVDADYDMETHVYACASVYSIHIHEFEDWYYSEDDLED